MSYVISVVSTKGGVGKSFLARNIGILLGKEYENKNICIVDLCQNSSIATGFLKERDSFAYYVTDWLIHDVSLQEVVQNFEDNIYYLPSDEKIDDYPNHLNALHKAKALNHFSEKMAILKEIFEIIIIDTHPSENNETVSQAIMQSDYVIIPATLNRDDIVALARTTEVINDFIDYKFKIDYGYILNKSDTIKDFKVTEQKFLEELDSFNVPTDKYLGYVRFSTKVSSLTNENKMLHKQEDKYSKNVINDISSIIKKLPTFD